MRTLRKGLCGCFQELLLLDLDARLVVEKAGDDVFRTVNAFPLIGEYAIMARNSEGEFFMLTIRASLNGSLLLRLGRY